MSNVLQWALSLPLTESTRAVVQEHSDGQPRVGQIYRIGESYRILRAWRGGIASFGWYENTPEVLDCLPWPNVHGETLLRKIRTRSYILVSSTPTKEMFRAVNPG
jgi:hypothetical protein